MSAFADLTQLANATLAAALASNHAVTVLPQTPNHLWFVRHADGRCFSHSFTPPAPRDEVDGGYPDAIEIEPEEDDVVDAAPPPHAPPAAIMIHLVSCDDCRHYRPDPVGHGGLGHCLTEAPESRRIGSLWPGSRLFCSSFEALAIERDNDKVSPCSPPQHAT